MSLFNPIIAKLIKKKISISVAESCTGGLLSSIITKVPGASEIFNMGLVTYSNKSKNKILRINNNYLDKYGAVSNQIANEMLKNLYNLSKSDLCIITTGIAGPGGGTKFKPVGLVFIGIKFNKEIFILKKKIQGN